MDFLANAEIEGSNFKNKKSHIKKFFIFELFVNFSTDSDSSAINFFRTGSKHAYTFIKKDSKIPFLHEKKEGNMILKLEMVK